MPGQWTGGRNCRKRAQHGDWEEASRVPAALPSLVVVESHETADGPTGFGSGAAERVPGGTPEDEEVDVMDLEAIQSAITEQGFDGWLFFDFQNRDPVSYRILGLPDKHTSRRWYYFVPAQGQPVKLAHRVEPGKLDALPGRKVLYSSWKEMKASLSEILSGARRVAMQYSPECASPYISLVDAGTVELVRSTGVEVVSSADLVQRFEGLVDEAGFELHRRAGEKIHRLLAQAWEKVREGLRQGRPATEVEIQRFLAQGFESEGLTCDGTPPIVAVDEHAADPHFEPNEADDRPIEAGSRLLIDLWARMDVPEGIYYDITWCAKVGSEPDERYEEVFALAVRARDAAVEFVRNRLAEGREVAGWEVDDVCRSVIEEAGLGRAFVHRTGHSIGHEVHGNGVNIDNLETQDRRKLVPGALFSIEPGIYLPEERLGVRTEVDVYVTSNNEAVIEGPVQSELVVIEA